MITTPQLPSTSHTRTAQSRVTAACAYLERGMPREAQAELDAMTPPEASSWRALVLRVSVHMDLEEWEAMRLAALHLGDLCPDDPKWPLCVAYATRRAVSVEQAKAVLLKAEPLFPSDAGIKYNLACFAAQLGELPVARRYLEAAVRLDPAWRETARQEPDLEQLWGSLIKW